MRSLFRHTSNHPARSLIAALVALCVLLASLMGASPELHGLVHHDSDHADHHCLVTAMTDGGMDVTVIVPVIVSAQVTQVQRVKLLHSVWVRPLFLCAGLLEHGPPVVC